MYVILKTWKLY